MTQDTSPKALAKRLLSILEKDRERLLTFDAYIRGNHADPYMPELADAEYKLLAKRSVSNWIPLLLATPAQALYVDGFRRGYERKKVTGPEQSAEMKHWQRSRLDARQHPLYRAALGYGQAFTVTELNERNEAETRSLSPLRTSALYEDPANDLVPYATITVRKRPRLDVDSKVLLGEATLWADGRKYQISFDGLNEIKTIVQVGTFDSHPITRFAPWVDLEGRTVGIVEPIIPIQDRINQTVFDLLVAQTGGSFKVRWVTGMAPPVQRDEEGEVVLDKDGQPIPLKENLNAKRFLFAEDDTVKFGSLDETPLDGYINSIDQIIRHLSAISQTPPHHLLGQIANLSAEALQAAEVALQRKVLELQSSFGESWERVFTLAAELEGDANAAHDYSGEVLWRDMEGRSISQVADALGKLSEQLGIPKRALWPRVPDVTTNELEDWDRLAEEEIPELAASRAVYRATGSRQTLTEV